ncbi:hypothetical protein H6B27_08905 [Pseudoflavonifractor phocaeensis]|nr:hypothetical protein [Pseudoflavonifractor phocaeensis]
MEAELSGKYDLLVRISAGKTKDQVKTSRREQVPNQLTSVRKQRTSPSREISPKDGRRKIEFPGNCIREELLQSNGFPNSSANL